MKKMIAALILGSGLAAVGCETGTIRADALDVPMSSILRRHDAYVTADASLSEVEKTTYLRSSALMKRLLDEAMQRPSMP